MGDQTAGLERVAFIGTGVMGASMARTLMQAGYALTVHTRSPEKADPLVAEGATWAASVADAVGDADAVISIVGYPKDVEEVYLGEGGIVAHAREGALLIDMTTSAPSLAQRIADAAAARSQQSLDAPVSGGDIGARNGSLSIMVGGERTAFERARPLFEVMGETIVYQGPAGSGQHTKMCNQITVAGTMVGITEALVYARRAGLDPETVLQSIGSGAAASWALTNLWPRMIAGDEEPGFYVRHFIKDMDIALAGAAELGAQLPGLDLTRTLYSKLVRLGAADKGTQALPRIYEDRAPDA